MSVRSQRHLREFYGIDSAGESDEPQIPVLVPALALDFSSLTPETLAAAGVTHVSTSLRMRYDETGKLTYCPHNLCLHSQELDAWPFIANLSRTVDAAVAPDGTTTADKLTVTSAAGHHYLYQSIAVSSGATVTVSLYAKDVDNRYVHINSGDNLSYDAVTFDLQSVTITQRTSATWTHVGDSITSVGGGWYRLSVTTTVVGTNVNPALGLPSSGTPTLNANGNVTATVNSQSVYIWGVQLEQVTYETSPRTYNLTTSSAYYGPRFDCDPVTHEVKGILIEEQRTNIVIYSRPNIATLGWDGSGGQGASMTEHAAIAPDGTLSATHIHETVFGPPYHGIQTDVFSKSNAIETWTGSIYAKSAERTVVDLEIGNTGLSDGAGVFYNLTTGVLVSQFDYGGTYHVVSTSIEDVGNGWWRAAITVTTDTDTGIRLWIGTGYSGVGDGTSGNLLWGAQIEKGAFATSLIPTVATGLTRPADLAAMTGSNFTDWFNASEGTFVVDWGASLSPSAFNGPIANQYNSWLGGNGNDANYGSGNITVGGTTSWGGTLGGALAAEQSAGKGAVAYSSAGGSLALNGVSSTALGAMVVGYPSGDFFIGSNLNGYHWNGCIKSVQFYNTRLTDAQLQALTA